MEILPFPTAFPVAIAPAAAALSGRAESTAETIATPCAGSPSVTVVPPARNPAILRWAWDAPSPMNRKTCRTDGCSLSHAHIVRHSAADSG